MKKGQVLAPTGSGKTLMEHALIVECMDAGQEIFLVLAPRIALVHQLIKEFWTHKNRPWTALCVCSSSLDLDYYEGERADTRVPATTKVVDIKKTINKTAGPIIIFGTYHSAIRIQQALLELHRKADLAIMDEAHNLTKGDWSSYCKDLPCKAQVYFTATRKISVYGDGRGVGMDNVEMFGDVWKKIEPYDLIQKGRILPPMIHCMYPVDAEDLDLLNDREELHLSIQMVVGGALRHAQELKGAPARIIVSCSSVPDAHDMAESKAIQDALQGWSIGCVSSDIERMKSNSREDVFNTFTTAERSILFHYDIVSEGVDLPGATGVLPLRELGQIKMIQTIGRVLRLHPIDRERFDRGEISVTDRSEWIKGYGWILLPIMGGSLDQAMCFIGDAARALRDGNFDFDVEAMTIVEQSTPRNDPDNKAQLAEPKLELVLDLFDGLPEQLKDIGEKIRHEFDEEYKTSVKPKTQYVITGDDDPLLVFA
jgi:superfamily II DNA or RNA helicase